MSIGKPRRPKPGCRRILVLAICLLPVAPLSTLAQTTGTVEGTVVDQGNVALPGVNVELTGPSLQGTRTAVTSTSGVYRFPSVPPGGYAITASLPGLGKVQKTAAVSLDATATVNLQLAFTASAEVTVSGQAPLIDKTSTTSGSNYSGKVIDKLPVASRNYADIVFTQPGVQADTGETQGGRSLAISIYGSTSAENSFLIDGINTTSVIKGIQGKDINNEFVQEVEVKTSGYQAEYGRNTGGIVNVITKSGGNEFHGALFGYYNSTGMKTSADFVSTPVYSGTGDAQAAGQGVLVEDNRQEAGADLGGFVLKDRIWFFAAYDRTQIHQSETPTSGPVEGQDFPIGYTENKYAGKLTFNLAAGTSLVGSYFSDRQSQTGAIAVPQGTNSYSYNGRIDTGGPDYGARLNQLFGASGLLTLQYGHHSDRYLTKPEGRNVPAIGDDTPLAFGADAGDSIGGYGGVSGPTQNNASTRNTYVSIFTAYVGNHEIKAGGDYQGDETRGSSYYTGTYGTDIRPCTQTGTSVCDLGKAPTYTNLENNTTKVYYHHYFYTANDGTLTPLIVTPFDVPTNRWSAFLQDQWRITPRITANLGIRYDAESVKRGNGAPAFNLTGEWSPRVGVAWDIWGDGTSKLYASAGRFYYSLPTDLAVRVYTTFTAVSTFNYSFANLAQDQTAPRPIKIQTGSYDGEPVDPGLKESYQDEFTIGFEKAIDPTLSVGAKGTYRSLGRTIEDRCDLDPFTPPLNSSCALANPGSKGPASLGLYAVCDGSGNPTDPTSGQCGLNGVPLPAAKRIFRGIEFVARKQISNAFWAQLSYLYSSLEGNYSGAVKESTGQTDPGINADFDYYQLAINAYGRLELDRPSQARLDAVYNAPFGLSAGIQLYVRSGTPYSQGGWFNPFYPEELYLDPRGSLGRTPTDTEMNLSLAYNLVVGPVTVTPQIIILNLFNNQTATAYDSRLNPNGSFVTDPTSVFYGQAGVQPGTPGQDGTLCTKPTPCTDNPNYLKITGRTDPRLFRAVLKVSF